MPRASFPPFHSAPLPLHEVFSPWTPDSTPPSPLAWATTAILVLVLCPENATRQDTCEKCCAFPPGGTAWQPWVPPAPNTTTLFLPRCFRPPAPGESADSRIMHPTAPRHSGGLGGMVIGRADPPDCLHGLGHRGRRECQRWLPAGGTGSNGRASLNGCMYGWIDDGILDDPAFVLDGMRA